MKGAGTVRFGALAAGDAGQRVLVVDDSRAQRHVLAMLLRRWGYQVMEASTGEEALALCEEMPVGFVICGWILAGMSGVEFCAKFKSLPHEGYSYFMLLTSKSEKSEIADGLLAGADDFVPKPVGGDELRARLRAGQRILSMQAELVEKNRLIAANMQELQKLYDALDRDLIEARKLQQTLVSERFRDFGRASVSLMIRSSGHVGGDLVGSFAIDDTKLAVYSVDVSGHGVASAMMTARLAGYLSGSAPEQNLALVQGADGRRQARRPAEVAQAFNRLMIRDLQVEQYFTMAYAELDLTSGRVVLVQAGHPHPMVLRASGKVELIGAPGLPIGLIEGATYHDSAVTLAPGDRLFLMSDGLTECARATGEDLGEAGVVQLLQRLSDLPSQALLDALLWDLGEFAGTDSFADDVSGLLLDYRG
ncbi:SpoIIE family protein phosphatase [Xinfangfangia sp. CPCC 101601]|uniref:SpoIIE family protein phosphatase n=1 Tax=Pseudogemmobacter lacusdianii TaxID=3069608 RepID=A0ABU0VTX6_9RHOB|nr:SpoIIE family protein phosphatase [Xinfangfangia sp. CPCC 101601]MDQ2065163.1 SpoIIE family protein phosphatase [Xinfangfangia sp. CPCC 101601]